MDIKKLKKDYEMVKGFFEELGGEEFSKGFTIEIFCYLTFLAGADKKFSDKETKFIQDILGIKSKSLPDIYKQIDRNAFANNIPLCLTILVEGDKGLGIDIKESTSLGYITLCYQLGNALLEIDGKTELEEATMTKYLDFLTNHCEETLKPRKQDSSDKKTETAPKKETTPAKTETKQKPQAKTEKVKAREPEPAKFKPAPSATKTTGKGKPAIQIPASGPTTMLAFWEALKPFLAQMRHKEFDKTELKETDIHNAKATIITGAYNSIMIRKSQKVLRLELYINTETEAGNLQIFDHIQKNVKIPPALKGQVEFNRKEGRHGQRIYVNFEGFELSDRSCWAKYVELIISVADDFFDALEKPMKELVG